MRLSLNQTMVPWYLQTTGQRSVGGRVHLLLLVDTVADATSGASDAGGHGTEDGDADATSGASN